MGEHLAVGGLAAHRYGGEQTALKPAAMLIGAFEVEISGIVQLWICV